MSRHDEPTPEAAGEAAGDAIAEAVFVPVRDVAVSLGRALVAALSVEVLERAIAEADRALAVGPILDPTLARDAGPELELELRFLRATLGYRRELELLRPATEASS